jgi:putative ABC transport system permease protein
VLFAMTFEHLRAWFGRMGASWLDVKLGIRMLFRHPGLTLVAIFALSIGIPTSLIPVHLIDSLAADLPIEGGDEILGIRNRNIAEGRNVVRSLHDFFIWREELSTFEAIAAARTDPFNVISDDGRASPIRGSEITGAAFQILRVPPLMGRTLIPSDEVPGAPDVVLISFDMWQSRLAGASDVVGTTIRIGTTPHEVVGVMPEGFLFPMRDLLWVPLRDRPTEYERGMGPDIIIFGRLADGASIEEAQAELTNIGTRLASEFPQTNERLVPRVMPYTAMMVGLDPGDRVEIYFVQLIALVLLAIVCGNVGTLILARTSTRSGELAIRTALGASRMRIVSQLFVESLVLAVVSAGIGLFLGDLFANAFAQRAFLEAPFWFDLGVKPKTVAFALSVATFCAVIAGVVPALKSTGKRVQHSLQGARAGSALRFGGVSTLLIVAELALAVGFLTAGGLLSQGFLAGTSVDMEIEPEESVMGLLRIPWTDHSAVENDLRVEEFRLEVAETHETLLRRLIAEPGVRGVAMGTGLPGMSHPGRRIEVEGEDRTDDSQGHLVRQARVDVGFFEGLGVAVRGGRDFTTADVDSATQVGRPVVIANTGLVEHVLEGRNPIGRRIRYVVPEDQEAGPWFEIVGVVGHLGMNEADPSRDDGIYFPAAPGRIHPIWMAVRVGDNPLSFTPTLRDITRQVNPQAMIQYTSALDDAPNGDKQGIRYGSILLLFLSGIAIVLSGAGLYALMSFTVSQRTREIGVRTALGASSARVVLAIAQRALFQLVAGTAVGVALGLWFISEVVDDPSTYAISPGVILAGCASFMFLVGILACVVPTVRGLRIQPVEALREA